MLRFYIAVIVAKLVRAVGKQVGRASTAPGQFVLKICPSFFERLTTRGKVIVITGSNGKTTTSQQVAFILRKQGFKVLHNYEGANVVAGIATALADGCSLSGALNYDYIVLEVDERHVRLVFEHFPLDILLLNNLVRDQVVRNSHPDFVMEKIAQGIRPGTTLILNANDPISHRICPGNKRVYFAMAKTPLSTDESVNITHDCKICPECFKPLKYEYYHYNHIGSYSCPSCGFSMPQPDFLADNINFGAGTYTLNGHPAMTSFPVPFHILNTAGAVAVAVTAGVETGAAVCAASAFVVSQDRYMEFEFDSRKAVLILTKQNSVSLDQSISFTLGKPGKKTVLFYVNNVIYSEQYEVSWLYDVSVARMLGQVDQFVCSGTRAYDVGVWLEHCGFAREQLFIEPVLERVPDMLRRTEGDIYILAASAFGNEDGILEVLKQ